MDDTPGSVEEAGALLGAAITKCNVTLSPSIKPPKGMHSSFAITSPVPSSELFTRLYQLRELLQNVPKTQPLQAAPSLLAVLMKLLAVSSSLAPQFMKGNRVITPPLWSNALRRLWVDSVVLCHVLGESLTGKARIDVYAFCKNMVALAGLNPKSGKAAGGTRIAALQVIAGLFRQLPQKLSPWALDVLHLCHKSLKSSGSGEPSYRIAAMDTAAAVASACRESRVMQQQRQNQQSNRSLATFVLPGAMEEQALQEALKMLKHATADKFPEVRYGAAQACVALSAMFIVTTPTPANSQSASALLEEVIHVCTKNLDDESVAVAVAWATALARCLCTAIAYHAMTQQANMRRETEQDSPEGARNSMNSSNKAVPVVATCSSLPAAVKYLVELFVSRGGELAASRLGGTYSMGGRAVRLGICMTLVKLLSLQSQETPSVVGVEYTVKNMLMDVLAMVGPDLEKQLVSDAEFSMSSPTKNSIFGKTKSSADGGLARLACSRVIREGLSEIASEPTQLSILHELTVLCVGSSSSDLEVKSLNAQQLQVALTEISHLVTTLGEAAGSALEDLIPFLTNCLKHPDHGVRHEAAVACVAVAVPFPFKGRQMLNSSVTEIQVQHAELVTRASVEEAQPTNAALKRKPRFHRKDDIQVIDKSTHFQYAIHGHALLIALMLRELPKLPGGLPSEVLAMAMLVGEILVTCQYIDILTKINPSGACTCVRAGYGIICGSLTVGPDPIVPHVELLFGLWQKSGKSGQEGSNHFTLDHDLICLDAALSSVVSFLEHCSSLLMVVPEALSTTTVMLEQVLPLFLPNGRFSSMPSSTGQHSRYESAKANLMEAFAWLPPGSFPMVASEIFAFAFQHIQAATESEVMCSLLPNLVNNEDKILDAKSICRAQRYGQVGGIRDIDENCIILDCEATHYGERESVIHFQTSNYPISSVDKNELWDSRILGMFAFDGIDFSPPPTPLHEVGTWQKPACPSYSSKVRLVDAAVQAFSATFGLKDGKEQQQAMLLLQQMVPPLLAQLARAMGVNTSLNEAERRTKSKDDIAAVVNITAVLLACLKSLPLHEATHDVPIGLGPPWMNKAKDLLLTLLPSTSNTVRRAAAEGLALLATIGVTEDAHTLQSSMLHSLDEVMQGNKPDGKPRPIPVEPVSAARAGSLLTLGCIQRTAHNVEMMHRARSKGRSTTSESVATAQRDALPTMQMMTRVLPSIACHSMIRDAFVPRTFGTHAFNILLASSTYQKKELNEVDHHLLRKAIEAVEDNFLSCWTAVSFDMDNGQEPEKLGAEPSFLAVILRMMSFLVPTSDSQALSRFTRIAALIRDECASHPVVLTEAMAFFELLTKRCLDATLMPSTMKHVMETMQYRKASLDESFSIRCSEAAALLTHTVMTISNGSIEAKHSHEFHLLDMISGMRLCTIESVIRSLSAPREADRNYASQVQTEKLILSVIAEMKNHIKLSSIFVGNHNRWQVRAVALTAIANELCFNGAIPTTVVAELLHAACGAVVATSETHELRPIQEAGTKLLTVLVNSFGHLQDPADPGSLMMDQYSSQIFASVKHSVTLPGGDENEEASLLFMAGCAALEALIKKGIISESASFKRLVRPVIPTTQELSFVKLDSPASDSPFRGKSTLLHIAKLSSVSRIASLMDNHELSPEVGSFLMESTESSKAGLAVHCAAAAMDGWKLLKNSKDPGFFYGNVLDLAVETTELLVSSGPACLWNALVCLSEILLDDKLEEGKRKDCRMWFDALLPLALAGFNDAIVSISSASSELPAAEHISTSETATFCLHGLRSALHSGLKTGAFQKGRLADLLTTISEAIIHPALGLDLSATEDEEFFDISSVNEQLVSEACSFVEVVAELGVRDSGVESSLLNTLLTPLDAIQGGNLSLARSGVTHIVTSLMKATTSVIKTGNAKSSLVDAMLLFSTEMLSRDLPPDLKVASESLLGSCLNDESITAARQQSIALEMAQHGRWNAWSIIVNCCPSALPLSLKSVAMALEDQQNESHHTEALSSIRGILQRVDAATNPVVGIVLAGVGAPCFVLFKGYATLALPLRNMEKNRMNVCADTMKIIMASYQHVSSTRETQLVLFLSLIFEVLIDAIQYNGLPNQASPRTGANPILGRLSAQAIVHVARTTPSAFKETVAALDGHPRALLEFAVRAEMSGYASTGAAGTEKKKLNLASFQK